MGAAEWSIGDRVLVRGRGWQIREVRPWPDCSQVTLRELGGSISSQSLLLPFDRPRRLDCRPRMRGVRLRRWLHEVRRRTPHQTPYGGAAIAWRTAARLLPYQLEPLLSVIRHGATRLLIADAVGLGKTIQAGLILLELATRDEGFRALVLVPAGLRQQWHEELVTHLGLAPVQADAAWLRATEAERPPGINPWLLPGIYIVSIDFAKRVEVLQALEEVTWDAVILDEAHLAATPSDRRDAAHAVGIRSRRTILLTATPDMGDPVRFGALCEIGRVDRRESPVLLFRRTRADIAGGPGRRSVLLRVRPTLAEQRMHALLERYAGDVWREAVMRHDPRAKLAAILLQKRALSSAAALALSSQRRLDLLERNQTPAETQLLLPLADEDPLDDGVSDVVLSAPGLADPQREHRWLADIAEAARHAARAESKSRRLLRWLTRVSEPVIIFTEYRDTLERLERLLLDAGRPLVVLHGGLDPPQRSRAQRLFNAGGLTLLATDAAAEGLNLHHHCRVVLHYELPWRPARLEQRAGRVDRLGQARRVHEIALVAADTAERLVLAPLVTRAAAARRAGDVTSSLLDSMNEAAVAALVMQPADAVAPERLMPDDVPKTGAAIVRTINLRDEAEREVERLHACRSVATAPPRTQRRTTPSPAMVFSRWDSRRASSSSKVIVLFDLSLTDGTGRRVHTEPLALAIDHAPPKGTGLAWRSIRGLVDRLREEAATSGSPLQISLDHAIARMRDRIGSLHHTGGEEVRRRELALADAAPPSAARHMVQAGLFDRRAIRALARRESLREARLYDSGSHLETVERGARLVASHELAALLVVRRRH